MDDQRPMERRSRLWLFALLAGAVLLAPCAVLVGDAIATPGGGTAVVQQQRLPATGQQQELSRAGAQELATSRARAALQDRQRALYASDSRVPAAEPPAEPAIFNYMDHNGPGSKLSTRACPPDPARPPLLPPTQHLRTQKVVSVLPYSWEADLLEIRLLEHWDLVDHFIIIEAPLTFSGRPKPLHFSEGACARFARFAPKVTHVVLSGARLAGLGSAWQREDATRNATAEVISLLGLQLSDLVFLSDTDEIPHAPALLSAANRLWNALAAADGSADSGGSSTQKGSTQGSTSQQQGVAVPVQPVALPVQHLELDLYHFNFRHYVEQSQMRVVLFPVALLSRCQFAKLRFGLDSEEARRENCPAAKVLPQLGDAGVSTSYFFPPEQIALKFKSYSHTEDDNPARTDLNNIRLEILGARAPNRGDRLERLLSLYSPEAAAALRALSERSYRQQLLQEPASSSQQEAPLTS